MPDARILSKVQLPRFEPGGNVKIQTQITYVVGIQPPRTIVLDNAEPSDEAVVAAIRQDQAQPPPAAPKTVSF